MGVPSPLFHAVFHRVRQVLHPQGVSLHATRRLTLLVTGLLAARTSVLATVANDLDALGVTHATCPESIERRLRRTLSDGHLTPDRCYTPALPRLLQEAVARAPRGADSRVWLPLAADDSSNCERVHLFRVSLCGWGAGLPLAWATWPQNAPQPAGQYWRQVDVVLDQVATVLPPDVTVVLLGDRAFDVPAFVDRATARGWHWAVRGKALSALRFRDHQGREHAVRDLVQRYVGAPGRRWKARGWVFKDAGWRAASLVAVWAHGQQEPLVVLTDLPCRWTVRRLYRQRFWIEPTFRNDKTRGWQWETRQVRGLAHHQVLLVALAWVTLLTLCLGQATAEPQLATVARRAQRAVAQGRRPAKPQPARYSVFSHGLRALRHWLYHPLTRATGPPKGPLPWRLPPLDGRTWCQQWYHAQAQPFLFATTVRS